MKKPSEVEVVAMALYWEAWDSSEVGNVTPELALQSWKEILAKQSYRRRARAFLRALRGGR